MSVDLIITGYIKDIGIYDLIKFNEDENRFYRKVYNPFILLY